MIASADPPAQHVLDVSQGQQSNSSLRLSPGSSSANLRSPFRQVLSRSPTPSSTLLGLSSQRFLKLPVGTRVEVSPAAFKIAHRVGELVQAEQDIPASAGSALIVDYGGEKAYGNSFRVRNRSMASMIPEVFYKVTDTGAFISRRLKTTRSSTCSSDQGSAI